MVRLGGGFSGPKGNTQHAAWYSLREQWACLFFSTCSGGMVLLKETKSELGLMGS